jgi:prepilin-type N-terminal cleavage/methylation domain-containing protein
MQAVNPEISVVTHPVECKFYQKTSTAMKLLLPAHATVDRRGFTLVELLVVIAIIVILMSLLLTAVPAVRESGRKLEARNMANQVVVALNAYYTEYARFPSITDANSSQAPDPTKDAAVGDPAMNAEEVNNRVFHTLRNIPKGPNENHRTNPRKVVFFEGQAAKVNASGRARGGFYDRGLDGAAPPPEKDGCLFDPWGMQYGVIMDTTGDERIDLVDFYTDFAGADSTSGKAPRKRAGAFSMGKDEQLGTKGDKVYRRGSELSDDVVSWE